MKAEYTIKKHIIAFNVIVSLGIVAALISALVTSKDSDDLLALGFGVAMFGFWMLMTISSLKKRLTIDQDKIELRRLFGTESVKIADLASFKSYNEENESGIVLLSEEEKVLLRISSNFEKRHEIEILLSSILKNLDQEEYQQNLDEVLKEEKFGKSEEERTNNLQRATTAMRILNTIAVLLSITFLFFSNWNYDIVFGCFILIFVAYLVAFYQFKGLILLYSEKNDIKPSAFGFLMLGIVIGLRAMLDVNLLDYNLSFWIKVITPALCIAFLVQRFINHDKSILHQLIEALVLSLFMASFSFGALTISNILLDQSQVVDYSVEVKSKHTSNSDDPDYYADIISNDAKIGSREVKITKRLYKRIQEGDNLSLRVKNGAWDIPYYYVFGK